MTVSKIYPRLVVGDAARAIDFYTDVFGATEVARHHGPDGRIVHAALTLAGATVAVKDQDQADPAPTTLGGSPVIMALYVDDADALGARMVAAGATVVYPIDDQPHGERGGRLADPFGHLWMIAQANNVGDTAAS